MQAMRVYTAFCIAGWLAIYFAQVCFIILGDLTSAFT